MISADQYIPVIDLSPFTDGSSKDEERRQDTAADLVRICHEHGCVGVKGHGFSRQTLATLFAAAEKLFAMPVGEKMKAPHPLAAIPNRGYSGLGSERAHTKEEMAEANEEVIAKKNLITDYKEGFLVGSEENKVNYNIWYPEDVFPGFRSTMMKAYWEFHSQCLIVLEAFMAGLSLTEAEKEELRAVHSGDNDALRLLHYPPVPAHVADNKLSGRFQAHSDWSTFSVLFQDSAGGLEFEDRKTGIFLPATPPASDSTDVLFLNVGDMLQRITNDYLPSSQHRVVIPTERIKSASGEETSPRRYSVPYFFMPDDEKVIAPLQSILANHGPRKYDPISPAEYVAFRSKLMYEQARKEQEGS